MKRLVEKDDMTALSDGDLKKIKTNVRKGAQDTEQRWSTALELVHTAYSVAQVQRPDNNMKAAWSQYEDVIRYAVQELAKARGITGDWRKTPINEDVDEESEFSVETFVDGLPVTVVKKAKDIGQIIKPFYDHNVTGCDIEMRHRSLNHVCLHFCRDGKRTGKKVTIRKK